MQRDPDNRMFLHLLEIRYRSPDTYCGSMRQQTVSCSRILACPFEKLP